MFISFYGVGFNSRGRYKTKVNGKHTAAYSTWKNMFLRCYCPKSQKKNPTYIGCTVDSEWHDFQDFAEWFESHEYGGRGYQLDKDILRPGNKVYSPETCCLVPSEINSLLTDSGAARGSCPQGVVFHKSTGKYISSLKINGRSKYIGSFECANEAYQEYKRVKEDYVKKKALEWRGRIATNVFNALIKWKLVA